MSFVRRDLPHNANCRRPGVAATGISPALDLGPFCFEERAALDHADFSTGSADSAKMLRHETGYGHEIGQPACKAGVEPAIAVISLDVCELDHDRGSSTKPGEEKQSLSRASIDHDVRLK